MLPSSHYQAMGQPTLEVDKALEELENIQLGLDLGLDTEVHSAVMDRQSLD